MGNGSLVISERELEAAPGATYKRRNEPDYYPAVLDCMSNLEAEEDEIEEPMAEPNVILLSRHRPMYSEDPDPTDPAPAALAA